MTGDLSPDELRRLGGDAVERLARYLEGIENRRVLPTTRPGDVIAQLPPAPPQEPEDWESIERDLDGIVEPNLTHWQHPGYLAYFAVTGAVPGVVGEILTAGYNQIGILWRASPVLTELEQVMVRWLVQMVGLPDSFDGQLADTASTGTIVALLAAREQAFPNVRELGLSQLPQGVVYCSELAHSSVDKAVVVLGLGLAGLRKIAVKADHSMDLEALRRAVAEDRAAGYRPIAVVSTIGTTSVASVDPTAAIAELCERERLWLHVDAAYAGSAAMLPELRHHFAGWERADSVVFNPHKWMFVPQGCTALLFQRMERVRRALSVVPHYLETPEGMGGGAREYMDYSLQLGRPFRALKLWLTIRMFGAEGMRTRLKEHLALAREFRAALERLPDVELVAPTHFSLVVFRYAPRELTPDEADVANRQILEAINADGRCFLSHAVVEGRTVLRVAIGSLRTRRRHLATFLEVFQQAVRKTRSGGRA